jgi:NNP family nitrate/nitrite transporter-like MFS transporter
MSKPSLMKSGHFPTLIAALLYFDVSFMVWVLLGPLAPFLSDHQWMKGLTPEQRQKIRDFYRQRYEEPPK